LRRSDGLVLLALATVTAVVAVGPAAATGLAGRESVDAYGSWWFQWFVGTSLADGSPLSSTNLLFFPWGKDILTHTGANLVDALITVPVRWTLGDRAAWNALYLVAIVSNALAVGLWLLAYGPSRLGAFAATVLAGLHPYPLYELAEGRPAQALLAPMVVACLAADRAFRGGHAALPWLAGVSLALAGWVYWYGGLFAAITIAVLAAFSPSRETARRLLTVGAVATLLSLPATLPLAQSLRAGEVPGLLPVDAWWRGDFALANAEGDVVRIATLSWDGQATFQGDHLGGGRGLVAGLGVVALCLAAPRRWAAAGLVAVAISLGPFIAEWRNPVYLSLASAFPPAQRLYWPVRAVAVLVPVAAVGAACAARRPWLLAMLAVATGVEPFLRGALPLPAWSLPDRTPWLCLGGAPGALIDLPYGRDQLPLVHQTFHGLPMLNGMHERSRFLVPAGQRELRSQNTYLAALLAAPVNPAANPTWSEADREALGALGYRWVALRLEALAEVGGPIHRARAARQRLDTLAGPASFEVSGVVVWAPWGGTTPCG